MIFDEYGRPFIILREQQAQARIRGKEAQKVGVFFARFFQKLAVEISRCWLAKGLLACPLSALCPPFPEAQCSTRTRTMAKHLCVLELLYLAPLKKRPMVDSGGRQISTRYVLAQIPETGKQTYLARSLERQRCIGSNIVEVVRLHGSFVPLLGASFLY